MRAPLPRPAPTAVAIAVVALACAGMPLAPDGAAAQAVPGSDARVVTFRDAVEMALSRNTDLQRARADADLQGTLQNREAMAFLPRISLSTQGRRSFGRSFSQEEGQILSETNDILDTGVSATVSLFEGMSRFASLEAASLREEASTLRLERTREDVLFQVVQGFATLIQDRELARVREEELAAARELLQQVRRLVDLGRQPLSDLYQQQAAFAEAEVARVEAERQVALTESALMQVLELDPLGSYDFRAPSLPDAPGPAVEYDLAELLRDALDARSDVAASRRALEATGQGVRAARGSYWPSVSLSFNYGSNWSANSVQPVPGTGSDPRTVTLEPVEGGEPVTLEIPGTGQSPRYRTVGFLDQLDGRRGGSVSLNLSLPLFDGLQTRAAVAQAEVQRLNARYDLEDRRQAVALQVRQALLDYRSAVAGAEATARRLEAASRGWEAAERRYELGAATFVEVIQARSTLVSARAADVQARYAVLLAQQRIEYHRGGLDPEDALFLDVGAQDPDPQDPDPLELDSPDPEEDPRP